MTSASPQGILGRPPFDMPNAESRSGCTGHHHAHVIIERSASEGQDQGRRVHYWHASNASRRRDARKFTTKNISRGRKTALAARVYAGLAPNKGATLAMIRYTSGRAKTGLPFLSLHPSRDPVSFHVLRQSPFLFSSYLSTMSSFHRLSFYSPTRVYVPCGSPC